MFLKDVLQIIKNTYEYFIFQINNEPTNLTTVRIEDKAFDWALKSINVYEVDYKNKCIVSTRSMDGDTYIIHKKVYYKINILNTLNVFRQKFHCYTDVFLFTQLDKKTIYDTQTKQSYNIKKIKDLELICDMLNKLRNCNLAGIRYCDTIVNKDEDKLQLANESELVQQKSDPTTKETDRIEDFVKQKVCDRIDEIASFSKTNPELCCDKPVKDLITKIIAEKELSNTENDLITKIIVEKESLNTEEKSNG